jgi:hypothetical protein
MSEGVSNVQAQVYVRSGSTRYLIGTPNPSQVGWQSLSAIVPFANNEQGQPVFYVEFEFTLGSGASRAQINIDSVEVLWTGYAQPQRSRPNPLKILHVNNPPHTSSALGSACGLYHYRFWADSLPQRILYIYPLRSLCQCGAND